MLHPRGAPQTSGHHEYVILSTLQRPRGNILSTSVACNDAATTVNEHAVRVATQYASAPCKLTISWHLFARWHLFRHVGYLGHQQEVDF